MGKSYNQYCPIAHALDLVGERWSLLIVRELSHGPLRYTDLLDRLCGCSTNMLVARLRELETGGVVTRRQLPPPTPATLYELTSVGEGLGPVLRALALWGARTLGPPDEGTEMQEGWLHRALQTAAAPVAPAGRFQLVCGEEAAGIADGRAVEGQLDRPDVTLSGSAGAVFALLVEGDLSGLEVAGSRAAARRLADALAGSGQRDQPDAARRSSSQARRTSASVVR